MAHHTAQSPELLQAVADRASTGRCLFTLLVPAQPHGLYRVVDPEDHGATEAQARLDAALPLVAEMADGTVSGIVGCHEPLAAIQDALNLIGFDEVIISMMPRRISRWLHLDLPSRVRALGLPVTEVITDDDYAGTDAA